MKDVFIVAIITGAFNLLAVMLSRWHSHREHKATAAEVREIRLILNGQNNDRP